ncbi:MAG: hypothetical protein WCZ65_00740 [Lysobacteraceae bacterium]
MTQPIHSFGVLALELSVDGDAGRVVLERDAAQALSAALGDDLRRLLPGVEALDAGIAAAGFDPAELLRPGWPVHAALGELTTAAPGRRGGRLIVFGGHEGRMAAPALQPDPALAGAALRLLPFSLGGEAAAIAAVSRHMEERLLDQGMASAELALQCQDAFGLRLEHARWMSLHDLCAMTAMQYQHAGMEGCWRLIEAALLAPDGEEWLREAGEPLALYRQGQVGIAEPPDDDADAEELRWRARRMQAVLAAHGIRATRHAVAAGGDAEATLRPSLQ